MALVNPTHRENCLCPVCRRGRGEVTRTKKHFNATMNIALLRTFRDVCRTKGVTLTEALEEAVANWMADENEQFTPEELSDIEEGRQQVRRGETEPLEKVAQELRDGRKKKRG